MCQKGYFKFSALNAEMAPASSLADTAEKCTMHVHDVTISQGGHCQQGHYFSPDVRTYDACSLENLEAKL